jgi:hypothetical protein
MEGRSGEGRGWGMERWFWDAAGVALRLLRGSFGGAVGTERWACIWADGKEPPYPELSELRRHTNLMSLDSDCYAIPPRIREERCAL